MSGDIVLGIRLKYDGKDVTGGVAFSREQFKQLASEAKKAGEASAGGFTSAAKGVRSISDQLDLAKKAALGYFSATQVAGNARWILDQASAMQQLDARLKVATASVQDYAVANAGVFEVANRWGTAIDSTVATFARLNPVIGQLGGNSAITLQMIDGLAASLRLSGATAAESSAVLVQFSQAMGSGRVGGDEFRSMMENAEPLMRAVAQQLGKTSSELRQMSEDGKLTSSVFGNALLPAIDKLRAKAEQIPLGIGQAWQVLQNNLSRDVGREFGGQANIAAEAIRGLSANTGELAAGLHAAEDAAVALFKVGVTAAAGAAGAWATKEARAAWMSVAAWNAARLARIADGEAAVASASLKAAAASAALAPLLAEKELIQQMAVYGPQAARIEREIAAAKAADTFATQELAAAESRLATERAASNLVTRTGTGATVAASAAMAALGGPLGLIVTGLTVGAAAWSLWGDSAENAADKAKKVSEDSAKDIADALEHIRQQQQRDATGNAYAPQIVREKEAISRLDADYKQARLGAERSITAAVREAEDERSKIIKKELDRRQENLKQLEDQSSTAGGSAKPRLSSASEYSKLTADLKWREKLVKDHQEALLNLQKAYADKSAATAEKDRPALLRNHQAALRAELERQKQELEALPDAKEGKAGADAMADARIRSMQAASKRVLEVLKHENEQYRLSSEEFIRTSAAVKANAIGEEIDALQAKIVAATRESERVPLRAKIADLKADLAGIAGEIAAGLEDADTRRRDLIAKLAVDSGRTLDPLARAGAEFGEKWGKAMQQAAANGWDDVLESGRAAWDSAAAKAMFDSAKARFEGVTKSAEASIENIRISAAIGTLPAVDALVGTEAVRRRAAADLEVIHAQLKAIAAGVEDPAIQTALAETTKRLQEAKLAALDAGTGWQAGARAAFVEYDRTVSDSAANTRRAFVDGYRRAEDAVVQFARTGKLNIRDFADYTINEYFRINAAQPFVRGLGSLAGMVGGMNFEGLMSSARVAATGVQPFDYSSYYAQAAYIDANAKGGVFNQAGKVHYFAQGAAFSNSVVSTPTYFGFGDGEVGQMAENGPEAVMPLKRGRGGRLGIEVMGGTGGSAAPIVFSPTFHIDARGAAVGVASLLENYVGRALQGFKADMMSELNSGGPLAVATGRRS